MNRIKDIMPKALVPGISGHYIHGTGMTFGYVEIKAGSQLPEHQHVHEQITYIIEGQLDMIIGGEACSLSTGMYYVIPSGTLHSAHAVTDCRIIDVFNPVREDYRVPTNL
jgi:quercetin dioxygenase-like cupin family protein